MMDSDDYDEIDRQILHAFQLDARVPFSRLAAVIGVSDQTVARRYARLRSAGSLRVRGLLDPRRQGRVEWIVRIRCTPDSAGQVAAALGRRPDTSWISRTSGGTELVCVTDAPTPADELLLKTLPRSARILDVQAHCLLHVYCGRGGGVLQKVAALSEAQVAALSRPVDEPAPPADPPIRLDEIDRRILAVLREDGRAPLARLATASGASAATVQRRITELRTSGPLYFDVDTDRTRLGLGLRTLLWLTVAPADLGRVGAALAGHPPVAFAAAISGSHNLHASVATPSVDALYSYLTTLLAALPAVRAVESSLVLQTVKGAAARPLE
jgi:DNA-binding Lrp family transcriptional regulator